jgi:hypothetical protein
MRTAMARVVFWESLVTFNLESGVDLESPCLNLTGIA